jgi:hypothetical protein
MALINCEDCQTEMSSLAVACPKCGRPNAVTSPATSSAAAQKSITPPRASKGAMALGGAAIGFALGTILVWQGCGHGESMNGQETTIAMFGGVVCGILGAVLGAVLGGNRS